MDVSRTRALRGPNMWSRHTTIEAVVHCSDRPSSSLERPAWLRGRACAQLFPTIGELRPASAQRTPISLAQVLEQATLALQAQAGCPVTFSQTHVTPEAGTLPDRHRVQPRRTSAASPSRQAVQAGGPPRCEGGELRRRRRAQAPCSELDEDIRLGPSTGSIVNAAIARGIPFRRLTQGSLVQFGWGAKQRRIWAAEVDATSAVSESIAQDKDLCKRLLQAAGVPVPIGRPVELRGRRLGRAAQEIGLPVVVKPQDGNQGKGVTVNVTTREAHRGRLQGCRRDRPGHGREVPARRRLPAARHRRQADCRRPPRPAARHRRRCAHRQAAGRQGQRRPANAATAMPRRSPRSASTTSPSRGSRSRASRPESVPEKGQRVILRNNANLSTGGTATDVTDDVHPEVAARAIAAAQVVGLHVCGVDVVAESVLRPLEEINGGIVEVNAAPGLRMHLSSPVLRQGPQRRRGHHRPPVSATGNKSRGRPHPRRSPSPARTARPPTTRLIAHHVSPAAA